MRLKKKKISTRNFVYENSNFFFLFIFSRCDLLSYFTESDIIPHKVLRHSNSGLTVLELNSLKTSDAGVYKCSVINTINTNNQVLEQVSI